MLDGLFTVIAVDGPAADLSDVGTDSLRYDGLSWEEAVELARLSFMQGFEIVLWREREENNGQTESAVSEKAV